MSAAPGRRAAADASANLVDGEFPFTQDDFDRIAALLYADSGIHLPGSKASLVYSRLARRLRALGLPTFMEYCKLVSGDGGETERRAMMSCLTTNLTRFFREPHHFDHLAEKVLPQMLTAAKAGARVRIWSAGCSSGEEPYSIALTVLATAPALADADFRILATDIDPLIVRRARDGIYNEDSLSSIPAAMRGKWLEKSGDQWSIGQAARQLIVFNELNLMGDWPMKGRFQAIFCRNVAIYFDEPTQTRLWGRFAERLNEGGRLYIGHSERAACDRLETDGLTTYRVKGPVR